MILKEELKPFKYLFNDEVVHSLTFVLFQANLLARGESLIIFILCSVENEFDESKVLEATKTRRGVLRIEVVKPYNV